MTCLDANLREKVLSSPATLDPAAPDLILFEKNKDKYRAELRRLSRAQFLASNGFEVYPVNFLQALYHMIMGIFGKTNPCDKAGVRHALKKLLYFGYIQQYLDNDNVHYLPERYLSTAEQNRFYNKKSSYLTEDLQNRLLQSYKILRPELENRQKPVFGQNLVQSNLWDTLLELEPQGGTILHALTSHYAELPIALADDSTIRDTLAQRFLDQGRWHIAIKIQANCLNGKEASTFATYIQQKQYLEAASFYEAYNGRVVFDPNLCKQLAENLYNEKQRKVRERDNKHAEAIALAKVTNPNIEQIRACFSRARKASETVIIYAQRSDILSTNEQNVRDKGFAKSLATGHLRAAEILLNQAAYIPDSEQLQHLDLIWSQLKMAQLPKEPLLTGYLEATEQFFEHLIAHYHKQITSSAQYAHKKQLALSLARYLDEILCVDDKFHEQIQKNTVFFAKIYWISGELNSYFHLDVHKTYLHLSMAYSLVPTNLLYMFSVGREHDVPHSAFRKLLLKNIAIEAKKQQRSLTELEQYIHQFWADPNAYASLQTWKRPAITTLERVQDLLNDTQTYFGGGLYSSLSMFQGSASKLKSLVHSFLENAASRGRNNAPDEDVHQSRTTMFGL